MPDTSFPAKRSLFRTRKRRAATVLCALGAVALFFVILQAWSVVGAIFDVQTASVVPLPPSIVSESASLGNDQQLPPESEPSLASIDGESTQNITTYDAQSSGSNAANDESINDHTPSRLEVAQAIVEAGMATGDPGLSTIWDGKTALNILVVGVDRREDGGDQNADVLILAKLNLVDHTLSGVSIPRDLLVNIPGYGEDKINGSYNDGVLANPDDPAAGIAQVRDTVEAAYGIAIDDYVLIDFNGFEDVIDALGGIDINVPYEIVDDAYPTADYGVETVTFHPGSQHMDGETALKYVRTRHADSDDARRARQIDVILAILSKGKSLSTLTHIDDLILAAGNAIQTSFTLEEQLTLSRLAREIDRGDIRIQSLSEPLLSPDWTEDGRWVYVGDEIEIKDFVTAALNGT